MQCVPVILLFGGHEQLTPGNPTSNLLQNIPWLPLPVILDMLRVWMVQQLHPSLAAVAVSLFARLLIAIRVWACCCQVVIPITLEAQRFTLCIHMWFRAFQCFD